MKPSYDEDDYLEDEDEDDEEDEDEEDDSDQGKAKLARRMRRVKGRTMVRAESERVDVRELYETSDHEQRATPKSNAECKTLDVLLTPGRWTRPTWARMELLQVAQLKAYPAWSGDSGGGARTRRCRN